MQTNCAEGSLPIGLAHGVRLRGGVPAGQPVRWQDTAIDETDEIVRIRRELEAEFAPAPSPTR